LGNAQAADDDRRAGGGKPRDRAAQIFFAPQQLAGGRIVTGENPLHAQRHDLAIRHCGRRSWSENALAGPLTPAVSYWSCQIFRSGRRIQAADHFTSLLPVKT